MRKTKLLSLLNQDIQLGEAKGRIWYFGFCHAHPLVKLPKYQEWFMRKDPPHLRHVYAFTQVGNNVLFLEPTHSRIDYVLKYPTQEFPIVSAEYMAQEIADQDHIVLRHKYIPSVGGKKSIFNWVPSCVTVIKCATGFNSTAYTPIKMLHHLIRDGAFVFLKGEPRICLKFLEASQKAQQQNSKDCKQNRLT